jgi:LCP family protein required for cell wall assembly
VTGFFIVVLATTIFIAVWDIRNISRASRKLFGDSSLVTLLRGGQLQAADNGRVNTLIAGYSADDPGHSGARLTDSIILLSMDPATKTGYVLSIPRDLYVNIPGFGYGKINEAYQDGGMRLLEKVVSDDFGVQISYTALINYAAVRGIVEALGGITVSINSSDGRLYDPNKDWTTGGPLVDLANGRHILNGQQALDLTRTRGDPTIYGQPIGFEQSDFQRTADQRLVFAAIKDKLSWKLVLDPRKNSRILDAVADNVKTDVPAAAARPLFGLFNDIPSQQLKSLSLRSLGGVNYLTGYTTVYGQSALIPAAGIDDYSSIRSALDNINL